ncbi:hypothetical protein BJ912DRAFT_1065697 [Pholiota molesta]|nr:hypothetical protein BJ912DRAFT_1065697 [Pholiota molesta]
MALLRTAPAVVTALSVSALVPTRSSLAPIRRCYGTELNIYEVIAALAHRAPAHSELNHLYLQHAREGEPLLKKPISALPVLPASGSSVVALVEIPGTYINQERILKTTMYTASFRKDKRTLTLGLREGYARSNVQQGRVPARAKPGVYIFENFSPSFALSPFISDFFPVSFFTLGSEHDCFCFTSANVPEIMPRAAMGGSLPSSRRLS